MRSKFLVFGLLFISSVAMAEDLDDAIDAMREGDFAEAFCILRPLAKAGDAYAQYNIGWMYHNGYGLRVNDQRALDWWQKASDQGHTDASFSLGMLYSLGDGEIGKDLDKAIDYYLIAAADGQEDAVTILELMMLRNNKAIRNRMHTILQQHGDLFGVKRRVKARKLNARSGPSVKDEVVTRLLKGQIVLEMFRQGRWSQVAVLDGESINQTVWVYNPLLESVPPVDRSAP